MTLTEAPTQESAEVGTINTALGTFSWQHLTGNANALPYLNPHDQGLDALGDPYWAGNLVVTPSGYAAIEHLRDPGSLVTRGPRYWRSPDGYEWTSGPLPVPVVAEDGARIEEFGGGYWLTTWNPATLWRSDDGETWLEVPLPDGAEPGWEPLQDIAGTIWLTSRNPPPGVWSLDNEGWVRIDTTALSPPDIDGVEWSLESWTLSSKGGGPATVGETTLFPWDLNMSVDYGAIGFDDLYAFWDPDIRTMVLHDETRTTVATLSVEAEGNRFLFIDEAGSVVHEIIINNDRLDPARLFDNPNFGSFRQLSLGVMDGEGRVIASVPPWGGFDAGGDVELLGVDGRNRLREARTVSSGDVPSGA